MLKGKIITTGSNKNCKSLSMNYKNVTHKKPFSYLRIPHPYWSVTWPIKLHSGGLAKIIASFTLRKGAFFYSQKYSLHLKLSRILHLCRISAALVKNASRFVPPKHWSHPIN